MDDDMPELEDFSEELKNIREKTGRNDNKEESTEIKVNVVEDKKQQVQPITTVAITTTKKEGESGLFKKGFFHRQAEKEKNQTQNKEISDSEIKKENNQKSSIVDLTHIKNAPEQKKDLIIKEVQEEMKNVNLGGSIMDKKEEWLNADLMQKIGNNPKLLQYFLNPKFQEVIFIK